jgi:hypothetical protein
MAKDESHQLRLLNSEDWDVATGKAQAQQAADRFLNATLNATAQYEAGNEELRSAFLNIPGIQTAFSKRNAVRRVPQRPRQTAFAPEQPTLRLGSQLIELPPFATIADSTSIGTNTILNLASPSGFAETILDAGVQERPVIVLGNGTCSGFAGMGQVFVVPAGVSIILCQTICDYHWKCSWESHLWRQAAGNLWIGHLIQRFRPDGTFLDQPVASQFVQSSFNDYNFDDDDSRSGASTGFAMTSMISTISPVIVGCFFWIGSYASAWPNHSYANTFISTTLTSMAIDTF